MELFSNLQQEMIIDTEHRKKMHWVLDDIRNSQFCEVCDKNIIKYVYSFRRSYEVCCSNECLDNYMGCLNYQNKWWM